MSWLRHVAYYWRIHANQISTALQRTRGGRVLVIGTSYGLTETLLALSCGVWLWAEELSGIVDSYYAAATQRAANFDAYELFTPNRGYDYVDTYWGAGRDLGYGDLYGSYLGTFWQQSQALLPVPDWVIWMTWDEWLIWVTIFLCAFSFVRRIRTSERFGKLPASVLFGMFIGGTEGAERFEDQRGDYHAKRRKHANNPQVLVQLRWMYRVDCCRLARAVLWAVLKAGPEWVLGWFRPDDHDAA
jgi:hypothetical protein